MLLGTSRTHLPFKRTHCFYNGIHRAEATKPHTNIHALHPRSPRHHFPTALSFRLDGLQNSREDRMSCVSMRFIQKIEFF